MKEEFNIQEFSELLDNHTNIIKKMAHVLTNNPDEIMQRIACACDLELSEKRIMTYFFKHKGFIHDACCKVIF
jgi:hypothetical protein